jgi:hypothetical protein
VIFNYDDQSGAYGTLKEAYFQALMSFWNNVVRSVFVSKGSIEAASTMVLPENFGGELRRSDDVK